ncbi:ABC transporter ATP-binding protein [Stagnihabitans tardus]|uniref:ATP-binding cassette domain-containing protein n=1 Tax=Stagnihabitans tardus TaxID=2699202 RepID=A0AAE4Y9M3_9RHOB|nr:ATP-binding cassette domain-containing protein [Stagnihabitans tardus]NBZ86279.1 ATP-binding cassette domain-containing protein [Stagnihabitans tardus]
MAQVELSNISKRYGAVEVIRDLGLTIKDGSFCALLGPSGCGKSTMLRMIAGLEAVTGGTIKIGDTDVTHTAPKSRGVAMVFQSYALYPHLTVAENITFSMSLAGAPKAAQRAAAEKVGKLLQLDQLLDRRPAALSGGQRQRVAIGRALVRDPKVFLFDEPLSNLDALLRVQMRLELARLHADLKTTMIYVTHDQVEAMTLADQIVVLDKGKIAQAGSPWELYNQPANRFVAGFIGSPGMNFLAGQGTAKGITLRDGTELALTRSAPGPVELGLRPEHFTIATDGPIRGRASVVEYLGNTSYAYIDTDHGPMVVEADGAGIKAGDQVGLVPDLSKAHLFDASGAAV